MTASRTPRPRTGSSADTPDNPAAKAAAVRTGKGSVQEAIGKLIGDDAARERGTAEKQAGADAATDAATRTKTSSRS